MARRKSLIRLYGLAGLIVVLVLASTMLSRPDGENYDFTKPPPKTTRDVSPDQATSVFSLDIAVPLPDMNTAARRLKIPQISGTDDGPRECSQTREGTTDCYTTKYLYTISTGSPTITPGVDNSINISIPAYVSGRGSHKGRGKDKSQSDIRYFQSKLVANANVSVSLDSKWCPRVKIEPDFLWKESTKVEVFHRAKVDLQYRVEKKLRDRVVNTGRSIVGNFISCDSVRQQLQDAWKPVNFPISTPGLGGSQYINIKPLSLGYIGLKLEGQNVFMEFSIGASTRISKSPERISQTELPPAFLANRENNLAYVSLPVNVNYLDILDKVHKQIGPEPFFTRNRFGEHTITIRKIRLYPSGANLVIGLQLHMTNTEEWLDRSGWVYILATPRLMPSSEGIMLSDFRFSEAADKNEWVTIRRALDESIMQTIIQRGLAVYFSEATKQLLDTMKNEIEKPKQNIPVEFNDSEFTINTISLLENRLVVNGALGATASYITQESLFETIAQTDRGAMPAELSSVDPNVQRIQRQVDSLIRQIEGLEKKLGQFRRILNN